MAADRARRTAFDLLLRIERNAAFADELLHSSRLDALDRRGRALVTELVMGCLRRRGELDHLAALQLAKSPRTLDLEVLTALRLGSYQLRYMHNVAAAAAVSASVELVKGAGKRSASGLVNAVLRRLPQAPPPAEAARLCHPAWLVSRWEAALGAEACARLLAANLQRPATYLRIRAAANEVKVLGELARAGVSAVPADLPRAYRVESGRLPPPAPGGQRDWAVQDLNSQRVASLLEVRPGHSVLDLCAAPGGKARILAETAPLVAADRHPHRLRALRRLGDQGLRPVALDARESLPFAARFERVLVDAPCSGTGTLARNPEIKWRLTASDLADLRARQMLILGRGLDALDANGRLVYATCSLEPEENEHVVEAVLESRPDWTATRLLATVPGRDPGDGFQAWRIQRRAA